MRSTSLTRVYRQYLFDEFHVTNSWGLLLGVGHTNLGAESEYNMIHVIQVHKDRSYS